MSRLAVLVACLGFVVPSAIADETATGVVYVDANGNGRRDADERPLEGVGVSNGAEVVKTDASGRYAISVSDDAIVFVIKPDGFRPVRDENHLSRFYYIHKPNGSPKALKFPGVEPTGPLPEQIDFAMYPQEESRQFDVLFFGDPQPRDQKEVDYIAHDVVEGLIGTDAAFGVTLGDILFDDLDLFENFNRMVGRIGVPWYNVIGNHDINYAVDRDELSDETFERVYGPAYYSFNYGGIHFIVVDDVHWMSDGERRFYRSGLSTAQLDFIENDLKLVPQDTLVVAMMHIPLVKSTPWLEPRRERLFRILETREHCVSLAGHTHHHEHVMIDEALGWKAKQPHHHIINVTVSGSWWSGAPDENGIPHTMCADGTPNGFTVMHFDGDNYMLEYRAARKDSDYQVRISAPEVFATSSATGQVFHANVFNAMPGAVVEWKTDLLDEWTPMKKVNVADPVHKALFDAEQPAKKAGTLAWRGMSRPMKCPHLWEATLPTTLAKKTHTILVRATNPNGQVLTGRRIIRIQ